MLIRKLDPQSFVHAYNVGLQMLYPWEGVIQPPFGAAWAVLAPGESTKPHAHQECETFFVMRGRGRMSIGEERVEVGPGDVSFHRPFDNHTLTNVSGDEDLLFLTVWWEDKEQWEAKRPPAGVGPSRVLVSASPPTPNGDLHLGHLAGPYLSADACARWLRMGGTDAHFVVGSDDNSLFTQTQGARMGLAAQPAADHFAAGIASTLEAAGIDLAAFPRPNASPHHAAGVKEFFSRLWERGELVDQESLEPFCEACGRFLFESYLRGRCPHCRSALMGNTCEDCGWLSDAAEIAEPACTACGATPVLRPLRRVIFPLARHAAYLRDLYRRAEVRTHLRALCEGMLAEGLPDVAVTHPTDWGIEVPVPGFEEQRIWVWFEMAPHYFTYTRHLEDALGAKEGWERWWKSPDAEVVQFFGFDNSFYFAVLLPALYHAFDPDMRPPSLVVNEFYHLEGLKFSTTRDHRILGRDLLAEAPREAVRWYLAKTCPEREETSFRREDFRRSIAEELAGVWEPWLADLGRRVAEGFAGRVPATGDWTPEHRRFYQRLQELLAEATEAYAIPTFSPQRAVGALSALVREARSYGLGERHWDAVPSRSEERRTAIALELLAAKLLGLLAAPVMPELAERIWRGLGYAEGPADGSRASALDWVPEGHEPDLRGPFIPGLAEYLAG